MFQGKAILAFAKAHEYLVRLNHDHACAIMFLPDCVFLPVLGQRVLRGLSLGISLHPSLGCSKQGYGGSPSVPPKAHTSVYTCIIGALFSRVYGLLANLRT